jgi:hypothetical protein
MDNFLSLGSSFIGGCLVAAIGYSVAFIGRVNRMESKLDSLTTMFEDHKKQEKQCPHHSKVERDIAVLQTQIDDKK